MAPWNVQFAELNFYLTIQDSPLADIDQMCKSAEEKEIGGILIGYYTEDCMTAVVVEATPPPQDSRMARYSFCRGLRGLSDKLSRCWKGHRRTYYIGEWHYHPVKTIVPSADDFLQMKVISVTDAYKCPEPILLIFGSGKESSGIRTLRAFVFPRGHEACELTRQ